MMRFFDILIAVLILIFFSPLIVVISILVLITDGRPIIYKQLRIGHMGKKFSIYKFRTMSNLIFKDEKLRLNSLLNVLKKDMSIVGPRPLPENIEKKIKKSFKIKRRKILPGITGMSQIHYTGKKRKLIDKIKLDIELIENYNTYNYFKILLKTPIALIIRFFKNKSSIIE